ncbi:MAG: hypothetical protein HQK77_20505 [Desulfobacterales bacterium]|nr:hypothetical protein [Desulfobacterales bacterium]
MEFTDIIQIIHLIIQESSQQDIWGVMMLVGVVLISLMLNYGVKQLPALLVNLYTVKKKYAVAQARAERGEVPWHKVMHYVFDDICIIKDKNRFMEQIDQALEKHRLGGESITVDFTKLTSANDNFIDSFTEVSFKVLSDNNIAISILFSGNSPSQIQQFKTGLSNIVAMSGKTSIVVKSV